MNNSADHIDITIINDKEMLALFNDLQTKVQNKIVNAGMRKAATIINQQAKVNLNAIKKGRSTKNYRDFNRAFKIEPIKNPKNGYGVKVGVKYYKARWVEWGTRERQYLTKNGVQHTTGAMQPTNFFYRAVETKKPEAQNLISESIMQSMRNIVAKYESGKL